MGGLARFNWDGFDAAAGLKVAAGFVIVLLLGEATGQSWFVSGLVLLFAWLTALPGKTSKRVGAVLIFGLASIALTLLSGLIGLELVSNVLAIAVVGFVGTLILVYGVRAFMVGYMIICWMIYGPFLIESTSVLNCVLAIIFACAVMLLFCGLHHWRSDASDLATTEFDTPNGDWSFAFPFSAAVAAILAAGMYLGWEFLTTDPTLVVGGAFFIIGFDRNKTWLAGVARVIGIFAGTFLGLFFFQWIENKLVLDLFSIAMIFLTFATMLIHPGAFMFFFLIFLTIGWQGLDPETQALNVNERLIGETAGVALGMAGIAIFQMLRKAPAT